MDKNIQPENCETCHAPLIHRQGTKDNGEAYDFWGCSNYPDCRFTWSATSKKRFSDKPKTIQQPMRVDVYEIYQKLDKIDKSLKILNDNIKAIFNRLP
jgi:ssDNA-binding Zn-finger/Zn-ribbon topoisomerase 1